MAYLKSRRLLIVVDLVVECGGLKTRLILADVNVLGRFEDCGLVLYVLRRDDCCQTALDRLPRGVEGTTEMVTRGAVLGPTVVIDGWLETIICFATEISGLTLPFHFGLQTSALIFLPLLFKLTLVLRKNGIFRTAHFLR